MSMTEHLLYQTHTHITMHNQNCLWPFVSHSSPGQKFFLLQSASPLCRKLKCESVGLGSEAGKKGHRKY